MPSFKKKKKRWQRVDLYMLEMVESEHVGVILRWQYPILETKLTLSGGQMVSQQSKWCDVLALFAQFFWPKYSNYLHSYVHCPSTHCCMQLLNKILLFMHVLSPVRSQFNIFFQPEFQNSIDYKN